MAQRVSRSHVTYLYPRAHLQAVIPFWNVGTPDTVAGLDAARERHDVLGHRGRPGSTLHPS